MGRDVFVDESQRKGHYLLASMAVEARRVPAVRREVQLVAPRGDGTARRHFVKESANDRRKLLTAYRSLADIELLVYEVCDASSVVSQRARALDFLIAELLERGVSRVVLDHVEERQRRRDRQVLARRLDGRRVSYGHEPAHSREPLLWVPDAIAWCAGRRDWRNELDGWVTVRRP